VIEETDTRERVARAVQEKAVEKVEKAAVKPQADETVAEKAAEKPQADEKTVEKAVEKPQAEEEAVQVNVAELEARIAGCNLAFRELEIALDEKASGTPPGSSRLRSG